MNESSPDKRSPSYGMQRTYEPPPSPRYPAGGGLSVEDGRTGAVLAHLGTFLNLTTGFLLVPFMLVITLAPFVHAAYAAYESHAKTGHSF